tara:strand:+ start:701 stop:1267 length:567 start_codon:yes stop_codon:yes gene_type:complete
MPWTFYNSSGQKLSSKGKVPVSDLANGTDGELITWGTDAVATTVAAGTSGHVLTSGGAGAVPSFALPALKSTVKTETRAAAAATGDVSYTGAGFTPTTIIAYAINTDDTDSFSVGFAGDAAEEGYLAMYAMAGTTLGAVFTRFIQINDSTNAHHQWAVVKTLDADGVTLTWTKVSNGRAVDFTLLYLR